MEYYFYHPFDYKVFVARGEIFLGKEFVVEGSHSKEIELGDDQANDEPPKSQEIDNDVEHLCFDILKFTQSLPLQ